MIEIFYEALVMLAILGSAIYLNLRSLNLIEPNSWGKGFLFVGLWSIAYGISIILGGFLHYAALEVFMPFTPSSGLFLFRIVGPIFAFFVLFAIYLLLDIVFRFYTFVMQNRSSEERKMGNIISLLLALGVLIIGGLYSFINLFPIFGIIMVYFIVQLFKVHSFLRWQDIGWQLLAYGFALPLLTLGVFDLRDDYRNIPLAILSMLIGLSIFAYYYKKKMPTIKITQ